LWDEKTCGVFLGIRPHHGQSHFVRAALEGICFGLHGVLKKLEAASSRITNLHVSGGVVHSQMWLQLLADVTGKNVCVLNTEDASAVGAAQLCFKALGITKDYSNAVNVSPTNTPNETNHAVYKKQFELFQNLYAALKPAMHQLYDGNNVFTNMGI